MKPFLPQKRVSSGLLLGSLLAMGLGLSACASVDAMFGSGNPSPAQASPREKVRAASLRCDSILDERNWLDCYYGAAQPVRADLGLPPAPASQQKLVPPL